MTRVNRATIRLLIGALVAVSIGPSPTAQTGSSVGAGVHRIEVRSTADGSMQPSYLVVPTCADGSGRMPLVVLLHTGGSISKPDSRGSRTMWFHVAGSRSRRISAGRTITQKPADRRSLSKTFSTPSPGFEAAFPSTTSESSWLAGRVAGS